MEKFASRMKSSDLKILIVQLAANVSQALIHSLLFRLHLNS